MTLTQLASRIAKREGKKHEASIGDIREILRIIAMMEAVSIREEDDDNGPLSALAHEALKLHARINR